MKQIKVTVNCFQKDEKGKKFFEVTKSETLKSGKVDNNNLSRFIINMLILSTSLGKLTGSNKPKLSKPVHVEYSINGQKKTMNVKFSFSEKRIEVLADKLPGIFLQSNRLYKLDFRKDERFTTNHKGTIVLAEIKPAKKLAKEALAVPAS